MEIRGLTLDEPFASLIALDLKHFETRSWATAYRGLLAIHAGMTMKPYARALLKDDVFKVVLGPLGVSEPFPHGKIIALTELKEVELIGAKERDHYEDSPEWAFGDYTPGRYAWHLNGLLVLPRPIPLTGRQQLWRMDDVKWPYDEANEPLSGVLLRMWEGREPEPTPYHGKKRDPRRRR